MIRATLEEKGQVANVTADRFGVWRCEPAALLDGVSLQVTYKHLEASREGRHRCTRMQLERCKSITIP